MIDEKVFDKQTSEEVERLPKLKCLQFLLTKYPENPSALSQREETESFESTPQFNFSYYKDMIKLNLQQKRLENNIKFKQNEGENEYKRTKKNDSSSQSITKSPSYKNGAHKK